VHEVAHFGRGVLSDLIWAGAPGDIRFLTAGSQGVFTFGGIPFRESAHLPSAAWSETVAHRPNGEILAAGVISQSVQVWNLSTGALLAELPGFSPVRLNRDGNLLVYRDADGNLRVYDLAAGQPVITLYSLYARLPVFSPDNSLLAAVNGYETRFGANHFVRIWDIQTGKIVNAVGGPDAAITDLAFSADGQSVIGAAGGSAWIWDVRPEVARPYQITLYTGEPNGNLMLYHRRVTAAALSPDNRLLAIGDSERNIWLYEVASGKLIYRMEGHAAPIDRLRFSPDGMRLLAADVDGAIWLWNVASGKAVESLAAHTGPISGLTLGLDGDLRAWATNTVWTLRPADGALVQTTSVYSGTIFAVSPAGDWLAVTSGLHMSVWDADDGALVQRLEGIANANPFVEHMWEGVILPGFYEASFSPDGNQLSTKAPGEIWVYDNDANNHFQLTSYEPWPTYQVLDEQAEPSTTSPDGFLSARAAQRWANYPSLVLLDQNGLEINRLPFPKEAWITALAFSPDARLIAVGQADGSIVLVDVAAWKIVAALAGHQGAVNALVFSADGARLASAGADGIVRFWGVK
jgi:WD40 repeat protein